MKHSEVKAAFVTLGANSKVRLKWLLMATIIATKAPFVSRKELSLNMSSEGTRASSCCAAGVRRSPEELLLW